MAALNPLIETLPAPPVPEVQAWARSYDGRHGPLIDMSQAVPGYPPHPDMLAWLGEAAADPEMCGYGAIEGEPALRQAYAEHVSQLYDARLAPANIHVTSGCNQAFIVAAMAAAGPGDRLLLTLPFYFNHDNSLAMLGSETRVLACKAERGFLPAPAEIADAISACDARAVALVSPNNPTGAVYPPELLEEIFAVCRKAGCWLILDETYRDFLPGGQPPHRLFSLPGWEDTVIGLYSFSKSYCIPGHRVGAVTAGERVVDAIAKIMDNLQICAPRAPQAALAKAIPALAAWRDENRAEIGRRRAALEAVFINLPGYRLASVGAYFAYLQHPFTVDSSIAVAERLARDAGVLAIPGDFFGPGQGEFLRLAFANADAATIALLRQRLGPPRA